ncbi:MAG: DUF2628 domain-containing protein, partial [Rhodospirillaceae bacterium]|nr:DUF2628 domain-containing protein [Rhodospirillaceae bacterium]
MNDTSSDATLDPDADVTPDEIAERMRKVAAFVGTQPEYYADNFKRIGAEAGFVRTFNVWAGVLGPVWFGARGLWNWGLTFLIIETFAFVEIIRGLFGDLSSSAWERIAQIEGTLALRKKQLAAAIEQSSEKVEVYRRTVDSLEGAIGGIRMEAKQLDESGIYIAVVGFAVLLAVKAAQAVYANTALERQFSEWLSDPTVASGMNANNIALG